ncbi:MAG: hypothetical protein RLY61_927 [Candidatus Parcubacteria bacterium]|jgi:phenylalanyl-tRNA synthetase alpha chain
MNEGLDVKLSNLRLVFQAKLTEAKQTGDFDTLYLAMFSKTNGEVTTLLKTLPTLDLAEKQKAGPLINAFIEEARNTIEHAKTEYLTTSINDPLIDLSLPTNTYPTGNLHPITLVTREINEFFRYYGYSIYEGPDIETAEYNFLKLNLPPGHPATDLQDSMFIQEPEVLLRTHTSSIEARLLTDQKPPIRAAFAGPCYRNETVNATNSSFFFQYQGVCVEQGISIGNLFATLTDFHKFLFGNDVKLRFRYKYYPEVSPGVGVDMECKFCKGQGCSVCKYRGFIEVLGSGMIHYNTLKMCGIDPETYTGFAFGIGLDRLVMQKYEINDIRKLYFHGMVYA